ncbi:MAG: helix-turn-helix domain-containing protein [Synergistaceae bacterium]|nr:helix-turn-helix domain-containing protein [Synergistaceae bacterium]
MEHVRPAPFSGHSSTDRTARRWKAAAVPQDERPKAQGIELLKAGATVASVAKELDVPERTVRNWKAAVVSQGDRPTLTSARPWKELGISRATWYKLRNDANR